MSNYISRLIAFILQKLHNSVTSEVREFVVDASLGVDAAAIEAELFAEHVCLVVSKVADTHRAPRPSDVDLHAPVPGGAPGHTVCDLRYCVR